MKDWAMVCLRKPETGCREGETRKSTTLMVIKLPPTRLRLSLDSVRVALRSIRCGDLRTMIHNIYVHVGQTFFNESWNDEVFKAPTPAP